MDLELKNKKALVFGSSTGIGLAVAKSLIAEGVQVTICSRNSDRLQKVAHEIGASHSVAADLSKPGEAARVVKEVIKKFNGIDILVTNTGGPNKGHFSEISETQWQTDFQSLWMSVVESLQTALPEMKKNNYGRVLMVTSIAGKEPIAGLTTSNGLRAGLEGLCKSVSTEMAPFGITLNVLRPGYTNTDRLKELKLTEERVKQMVPAGRLGDPKEFADFATFLASPKAGYITGQCVSIDGGAQKSHS
ncbi:MAG: SDR family oxidoreductase [Bdellovibrionota bacterium]